MKKIEDYTIEELVKVLNKKLKEDRGYFVYENLQRKNKISFCCGEEKDRYFIVKKRDIDNILKMLDEIKYSIVESVLK